MAFLKPFTHFVCELKVFRVSAVFFSFSAELQYFLVVHLLFPTGQQHKITNYFYYSRETSEKL